MTSLRDVLGNQYITAESRVLPLTCPGQRWFGRPDRPMRPEGLLIYGAPERAMVKVWIAGQPQLSLAHEGLPARLFAATSEAVAIARQLFPDWATVETAIGFELELRDREAKLLCPDDGCEVVLYGKAFLR